MFYILNAVSLAAIASVAVYLYRLDRKFVPRPCSCRKKGAHAR